ncbi:hypothetical protein HELRODRAFT_162879 [Helobdella robusta]|uniref:Endonuclease/exonuclease/phosphatase domain-containing protein n=1 Tax=Helobdella robusta TaxID=6412 RepID=T1ETB1_HELRO|nr:hypothetical protein HELRODRAFT_162879 [Helobdella robusta]ESN99348.1 hypothetical protein HELRODRAFT_162879 [Helobdella robusta]
MSSQKKKKSLIPQKTLNGQEATISRKYATVEGFCGKSGVPSWMIRLGTLNTGSVTGCSIEIVDMLERRRVDICSLQETRLKSNDAVRKTPSSEIPLICGDLNGHVGDKANGFHGVHGGFGYGSQNEDGIRILEFAESHELSLFDTYFKKRAEHLITYKSGMSCTHVRQQHRRLFRNTKVIPGEACTSQHRLLVADMTMERSRPVTDRMPARIKTWKQGEIRGVGIGTAGLSGEDRIKKFSYCWSRSME